MDKDLDNENVENKDEVAEQEQEIIEEKKIEEEKDKKLLDTIEKSLSNDVDDDVDDAEVDDEKEEKAGEEKQEDLHEKDDEADEKPTQEGKTDATQETLSKLNLNPRLLQAAKRSHISDEEVIDMGDTAELVLSKLADNLDLVSERLGALGRANKVKAPATTPIKESRKTTLELPEEMIDTDLGKQLSSVIESLSNQVSELENKLSEKDIQATSSILKERDEKIDMFFDGVSKDYSEFGNSKTLTTAEMVQRQNIWEKADDIIVGSKLNGEEASLEEALQQSMSIYEGNNPRKVKEKLLKDVKKREKSLISRPNSKKGSLASENSENKAVAAVEAYLKGQGKGGWD